MDGKLKTMVRGTYDLQHLRIGTGNRIASNFRVKLGQNPGEKTETIEPDEKKTLDEVIGSYRRMTDGLVKLPSFKKFKGDGIIDSYTELVLVSQYIGLLKQEDAQFKHLAEVLEEYPIYTKFLKDVRGIGPTIAGVIISEIDIHKAKYPSSLWKYAGLDVGPDGAGRSRRKEHLVEVEYTTADGEVKTKRGITYNPFLKTKLMGVLAASFLRAGGENNPYREIYDNYKHRMQNNGKWDNQPKGWKGHIDNAAKRYMIKQFLVNLHMTWRALEGLSVSRPYHEAKLGHVHQKKFA